MKELESYLIVEVTIALIPVFTDLGEIYCRVIERQAIFMVKKSPKSIIKESIMIYGGTYEGALKAAQHHFGKRYMLPIKISGYHRLYMMPNQSPNNEKCVWMAIHHVEGIKTINKKLLRIYFSGGHQLEVKMKEYQFNEKLSRTREYQDCIEKGVHKYSFLYRKESGYLIIMEDGNRNYNVISNRNNDSK